LIHVTEHAVKRWLARTNAPGVLPLEVWAEGEPITCAALDGDDFRYHDRSETVLVRRDEALVAVIDPASAADDRVREAVRGGGS